jgi:hypothetical protein
VHISGLEQQRSGGSSGPDGICASSPNQAIGLLRPCPLQVLKKLVSAICAIFSGSSISAGIFLTQECFFRYAARR